MLKFNRNYRAEFEIGHRDPSDHLFYAEKKIVIEYPFTCQFDITSGMYQSSNNGIFQFVNLSRQDQADLWLDVYNNGKKYIYMNFYAGYGKNMPLIFSGFVQSCTSQKPGGSTEFITEILAFVGGNFFQYGYLNVCVAKGTTLKDILDYATENYKNINVGYITPDIPPLPRDKTFIGQTMDLLGREYGGYNIFIDNEGINILGDNDVIPGEVQVINDESGLLGSPKRANGFVEVDMIFEPQLKAAQALSIVSETLPWLNQAYQAVRIRHKGIISPNVCGKLITTATLTIFPNKPRTLKKAAPSTYGGQPTTGMWEKPCNGIVTSPFGYRQSFTTSNGQKSSSNHTGLDIGAPLNTPIVAPANGKIFFSGFDGANGNCIRIDHGKINGKQVKSTLIHMNKLLVASQTQVYKGQQIGLVGSTGNSTGPHLHISIYEDGVPVDPIKYIGSY